MTHQVRITKVYKSDKSKDGKEFKDKNGKKFWKVAIKTDKFGDDFYSCLAFREDDRVMELAEGDEVTIAVEENGQYKNFKLPTKLDLLEERVTILETRINALTMPSQVKAGSNIQITDEDIPF